MARLRNQYGVGGLRQGTVAPGELRQLHTYGPQPLAPSMPGALQPGAHPPVTLPGMNFQPAGGYAVDVTGDGNIAPGGTASLVTIQVPDNVRFRIIGIGFQSDDVIALSYLTWSIRIFGDASQSYTGLPSAVGSVRQLSYIGQLIGSSALVTIVANIDPNAVLTYRYICRVQGWNYTETEGK